MSPSGKSGEVGVSGESGECAAWKLGSSGGTSLRGGNRTSCEAKTSEEEFGPGRDAGYPLLVMWETHFVDEDDLEGLALLGLPYRDLALTT